jgi:hypothetical protein
MKSVPRAEKTLIVPQDNFAQPDHVNLEMGFK